MTEVAHLWRGSPLPPSRMRRYRERRVMVAKISSTTGLHQWRKRFADRHIDGSGVLHFFTHAPAPYAVAIAPRDHQLMTRAPLARRRLSFGRTAMQLIEFWIVLKGEDAWKVAPEVAAAISAHPDSNKKCLLCGEDHESAAVIAFCWREPDADICTAGTCMHCAGHSDEQLAQMTQQRVFRDPVVRMIEKTCDEFEAMGLLETVGIDPVTGLKQRRLTAKGQEKDDLEAEAKRLSKR